MPVFVEWKIYGGIRWVLGSICQSELTLADAIITPEIDYIILLQQLMQMLEFFFSALKVLAGFGDSRAVDVIYTEAGITDGEQLLRTEDRRMEASRNESDFFLAESIRIVSDDSLFGIYTKDGIGLNMQIQFID